MPKFEEKRWISREEEGGKRKKMENLYKFQVVMVKSTRNPEGVGQLQKKSTSSTLFFLEKPKSFVTVYFYHALESLWIGDTV